MAIHVLLDANLVSIRYAIKCRTNFHYKENKILELVPRAGLEPARSFLRGILSPLCLPISPPGQSGQILSSNDTFCSVSLASRILYSDLILLFILTVDINEFKSTPMLSANLIKAKLSFGKHAPPKPFLPS